MLSWYRSHTLTVDVSLTSATTCSVSSKYHILNYMTIGLGYPIILPILIWVDHSTEPHMHVKMFICVDMHSACIMSPYMLLIYKRYKFPIHI